jgi:hypothetical protein
MVDGHVAARRGFVRGLYTRLEFRLQLFMARWPEPRRHDSSVFFAARIWFTRRPKYCVHTASGRLTHLTNNVTNYLLHVHHLQVCNVIIGRVKR